jgi:aminopeptidase N
MHRIKISHIVLFVWYLLMANTTLAYTRQDSLMGSNGAGRNWWDVQYYNLTVTFDIENRTIWGRNVIDLKTGEHTTGKLQLDLQEPMVLDKVTWREQPLQLEHEGNIWWVVCPYPEWPPNVDLTIVADYHGKPKEAKLPPWEGGFIWKKDTNGNPWISVACQGLGASSWWPCKDYQGDEPDRGMNIRFKVPLRTTVVSNGVNHFSEIDCDGNSLATWAVTNPINTYDATFYIGDYVHWTDTLMGEKGVLSLGYYALRENEEKAKKHFEVTKQMLHCFEHWMGPYPFYEDGYQMVEAPFLGMEHQSAVAYGNEYKLGYRGADRSETGVGNLFDFIIIHESGHEWFGNNITAKDVADNWLHEGFTTYAEALFIECAFDKEKAFQYTRGEWHNIRNDKPVIGSYGVRDDGSSDKYDKGSAVVHMIRMMMNDDEKFRKMLRELNKKYYHSIVTSLDVEAFIIDYSGLDLKSFFDQYLRQKEIPELEWYIKKKSLYFRFSNTVPGFSMPLEVTDGSKKEKITATTDWKNIRWTDNYDISFSKDFLIKPKS